MLIGLRQPKTKDDMNTNDELTTSATTHTNTMLVEVLSLYPFTLRAKDEFSELYQYDYNNSDNCQGKLLLRTLRNNSFRLSVTTIDDEDLYNEIDLCEFKNIVKLKKFMSLFVF